MGEENLALNKEDLQDEQVLQDDSHQDVLMQNESSQEVVYTNSHIKKEILDYQYQPLVDEIYQHLDKQHQKELELEYKQITERNNETIATPKSRMIVFYFLYKKTLYFVNNVISLIGYQFGWAFLHVSFLWFIHGVVLRGYLFGLYQNIIRLGNGIFDGIAKFFYANDVGFFTAPEGFQFSFDHIIKDYQTVPDFAFQLGHELVVYICTLTIIFFVIRLILFAIKNYRTKDQDANHLFEYDDKRSFFMLQSDKDDSIDYIKQNFFKRYRRFIGSDFQRRKYITSYVNVYQSGLLNTKDKTALTAKQYHKVIRSTILECLEHIIAWVSFAFSNLIVVLGVYAAYISLLYKSYASGYANPDFINQAFMEQSWWNTFAPIMISLSKIFNFIPGFESQIEFQRVFWGLFVFIMLMIMICSVYKRVIRPTKRHYVRYVHFYLKMNEGIYQENEKLKSASGFKIWFVLAVFIYIPFISFVILNIDAIHF